MRLGDLDALKKEFEKLGYTYRVTSIIDNAPTVEPETIKELGSEMLGIIKNVMPQIIEIAKENQRPQGKWIKLKASTIGHKSYCCSVCGAYLDTFEDENLKEDYPYCHCGAQMRGDDS